MRTTRKKSGTAAAGGLFVAACLASAALAGEPKPAPVKPAPDSAPKADPKGGKPGEEVRQAVGTVLYAPRMQTTRTSSAPALLTPEARKMTSRALDFLVKNQQNKGNWGDAQFAESSGVTALCCLALLAEGSQPNVGRYGRELTRGMDYLLDNAKDDGQLLGKDTYRYGPMYDHAWSTLCLLQAFGTMPWRRDYHDKLARAVQVLVRHQKLDGGWRYAMMKEGESDTLVTLNVLLTLRVAIKAGFSVPQESLDRAVAFIKTNALPDGRWGYFKGGEPGTVAISACGVIAIYGAGDYKNPQATISNDYVLNYFQRHTVGDLQETPYIIYGTFYCSQSMYMAGDKHWAPWFVKTMELFKASQRESGEFADQFGNKVYPTAMAALVMQAPYGYLPLYQR
jgi:hypothetical protein